MESEEERERERVEVWAPWIEYRLIRNYYIDEREDIETFLASNESAVIPFRMEAMPSK